MRERREAVNREMELVDESILYGVTHQFRIAIHSHFFQNTRAIRADGLDTQTQFFRNLRGRLSGSDHQHHFVLAIRKRFMERLSGLRLCA